MITSSSIKWRLKENWSWVDHYHSIYRDDDLMIQCEKITDRDDDGSPKGKPNTSFFIDNDEREFLTEEALIDAYNEKFKFEGENPEYEIKYIKVIQKRKTQD